METSHSHHPMPQRPLNGWMALSRGFDLMSLNREAQHLLGAETLPGDRWPLDRLFDDTDLGEARAAVSEALEHGRPPKKRLGHLKDVSGRRIPCEYTAQPLFEREQEIIGVILSFRGVTPSHRDTGMHSGADSTGLEPSTEKQDPIEDLPDGVFTIDDQWRITSFNRAAEAITGFRREDAMGKPCREIFRSDRCRKNCPMGQAFANKRPQTDHEVTILDRKGGRQTLVVNINVLRGKDGRVCGAVETFHPVETDTPAGLIKDGCFEGIVGSSPAMQSLFAMMPDVAVSGANTLISGESGTGKELIARALHALSLHRSGPFVAVNCASLPESLLESELFGHEKGAFTGADQSRAGRFELAANGTLFLDEIGEMKPNLQVKLLRVLEQRTFERVGGTKPLRFRARLIAATNQDLTRALREGRFREDLYYRLRTVPMTLPPLRERIEDIPLLVDHFIKKYNITSGKNVRSMDPKILSQLMAYDWPGNVRELERCIEHAFVFVKGPVIFQRYLPDLKGIRRQQQEAQSPPPQHLDPGDAESVRWALSQTGGRRQEAADLLGISRTSMWRRMKAFDLL